MRFYEICEDLEAGSSLVTKIVAVTNQLKQDVEDGNIPETYSVDDLLDYFRSYDVILDVTDLYNMIKTQPLKDVIQNIQGDDVVFKGQETDLEQPEDESKKVVAQMAQSAMKN